MPSFTVSRKRTHLEVIQMEELLEPKIYRVKINVNEDGCYWFSFKHAGEFKLNDYEELDFKVESAKLVRRKY